MSKGIYLLLFSTSGCLVSVGALGEVMFSRGWYGYVGSALGSGGFSRIIRHITLAEKKDKKPRWHVDYLLINPNFQLRKVYCAETETRLECRLAEELSGAQYSKIGSSDCSCRTHLFTWEKRPDDLIIRAFSSCGLIPRLFFQV